LHHKLEELNNDGKDTEKETIGRLARQFDFALSGNALFRQKLSTETSISLLYGF
jgi:hypothetical protein